MLIATIPFAEAMEVLVDTVREAEWYLEERR